MAGYDIKHLIMHDRGITLYSNETPVNYVLHVLLITIKQTTWKETQRQKDFILQIIF